MLNLTWITKYYMNEPEFLRRQKPNIHLILNNYPTNETNLLFFMEINFSQFLEFEASTIHILFCSHNLLQLLTNCSRNHNWRYNLSLSWLWNRQIICSFWRFVGHWSQLTLHFYTTGGHFYNIILEPIRRVQQNPNRQYRTAIQNRVSKIEPWHRNTAVYRPQYPYVCFEFQSIWSIIHILYSMENKSANFGEIWMRNKNFIDFLKCDMLMPINEQTMTISCSSFSWIFESKIETMNSFFSVNFLKMVYKHQCMFIYPCELGI